MSNIQYYPYLRRKKVFNETIKNLFFITNYKYFIFFIICYQKYVHHLKYEKNIYMLIR
jgi:hypothetical protein